MDGGDDGAEEPESDRNENDVNAGKGEEGSKDEDETSRLETLAARRPETKFRQLFVILILKFEI